ncbi:MAG: four helix bundle protein [bacterium]|nr:four helix bundle protein [bacterium]MDT8367529.1 four helix bundle protein [bacterium]
MSEINGFEDLISWQKARQLVRQVHELTNGVSFKKDHDLRRQICRASVSTMSNIAEGYEREGDREFIQFLSQAKASCGEVRSQLYVAHDLGNVNDKEFQSLHDIASETSRVISGLISYLRKSDYMGSKFK